MFSYLKGKVTNIYKDSIDLEVSGVGYKINTPNPYAFNLDDEVLIYTYLYVKDEVFTLYGFSDKEEKELFLKLISVSGIGPKSATAILATGSVNVITQAINRGDAKYLCKFPGIGTKSAQQIILDLKGKVISKGYTGNYLSLEDTHDALLSLGYNEKDIQKILPKLDSKKSVNELIRDALKLLTS